jgi:hypothetical protein
MIDDWPNINRRTGINLALRQLKNRVNLTRAPPSISTLSRSTPFSPSTVTPGVKLRAANKSARTRKASRRHSLLLHQPFACAIHFDPVLSFGYCQSLCYRRSGPWSRSRLRTAMRTPGVAR